LSFARSAMFVVALSLFWRQPAVNSAA
jgi:hypothetical protein